MATDKLTDVHQKVMGRYKSRVPGSAYEDDMLGYIHQIDRPSTSRASSSSASRTY